MSTLNTSTISVGLPCGGMIHSMSAKKVVTTNEIMDAISLLITHVSGLDDRVGGLEQRMGGLEQRMDKLESRMGGFEQRMDRMEHDIVVLQYGQREIDSKVDVLTEKVDVLAKAFDAEAIQGVDHERRIVTLEQCCLSH